MSLKYHPAVGTIVRVDLSEGFRPPEMVKRRPAVVLSPPIAGRSSLCTIVPLSTSKPKIILPCHFEFTLDPPLPMPFDSPTMWVKADIVLTVSFHRLRLLFSGYQNGTRVYDARVLDQEIMRQIRQCVRYGIGVDY